MQGWLGLHNVQHALLTFWHSSRWLVLGRLYQDWLKDDLVCRQSDFFKIYDINKNTIKSNHTHNWTVSKKNVSARHCNFDLFAWNLMGARYSLALFSQILRPMRWWTELLLVLRARYLRKSFPRSREIRPRYFDCTYKLKSATSPSARRSNFVNIFLPIARITKHSEYSYMTIRYSVLIIR